MIIEEQETERRLLAALIVEPAVLAGAGDVETQDFTDYRHWVVFAAIRQLQTESHDVGVLEIDDILAQRDRTYGSFLVEKCGAAYLGVLLIDCPRYNHEILWRHDMWWLRECRRIRERLEACA
jgi:DnaB helicase-like protein